MKTLIDSVYDTITKDFSVYDTLMKVAVSFTIVFVSFLLYLLFVWMPISLYAEANCLAAGYPKTHVSIGLKQYCSTLEGVVTVRVKELSEMTKEKP